ncbi:MAG TPA: serine/threonine-protein kinase [Polyangiaceae bacterium]|nr:serine/threonine-protein kinase [Polyangiaceae bacterium]
MAARHLSKNPPRLRSVDGANGPSAPGRAEESAAGPPSPPHPVDRALGEVRSSATPDYREGGIVAEKYRLIRKVGEGGMGTVWVAHNEALDVPVAIKFIRAGEDANRHVSRLTQEARAAAKIGHPAILRVFDFGKTDAGDPFIVMELLHGEDLAAALDRRGSLNERRAVQILLPILHALVSAHAKGIVHRDLKPDNIFLAETDAGRIQPKLVDFGVAKLNLRGFERLTQSGAVLGSPAYMSPEQARGRDVDAATDVWGACVVLYEMVTGSLPFEGDNYNALLWSILNDEPTPTSTQAGGDPRLWRIIQRGLAKDPRARHGSMFELGRELAAWLVANGVFVDVTGGSLQSTWLQRGDSGFDILGSLPPSVEAPPGWAEGTVSQSRAPAAPPEMRSTVPASELVAAPRSGARRAWMIAAFLAGALLLGALALFATRAGEGSTPAAPSATPAAGQAEPRGARDRDAPEVLPEPEPSAKPAANASEEPAAPATTPSATPATSTRASVRRAPPAPSPAKPPRKLKNPFGP